MAQEDNSKNSQPRIRIKAKFKNEQYVQHIHTRLSKIYPYVDKKIITKIISSYFLLAQEDLSHGNTISLGGILGDLCLMKTKREIFINDKGELVNNLPVDQKSTNELWKNKPELKGVKFVRHVNSHSNGYLFKLKHNKADVNIKNKSVYNFKFSRTLKTRLAKNIKNKEVEAYLIPNKDE